jgi:hypothetical protein
MKKTRSFLVALGLAAFTILASSVPAHAESDACKMAKEQVKDAVKVCKSWCKNKKGDEKAQCHRECDKKLNDAIDICQSS